MKIEVNLRKNKKITKFVERMRKIQKKVEITLTRVQEKTKKQADRRRKKAEK